MRARRARSSSRAAPPRGSTWSPSPTRGRASSPGDEILISALEHHANIVPWQMVCEQTGCTLQGGARSTAAANSSSRSSSACCRRARAWWRVAHVSNALGTVLPVRRIIEAAHAHGALVLIDGAQAVPHTPVDVAALGADFYAFSGHKLYGPTGIGVLYGREALLQAMPPWQGGGDMILTVSLREDHLQRAALQVRGRHAQYLRRRRAGRGHGLRRGPRPRRRSPPTRTRLLRARHRASSRSCRTSS